MSRFSVSRSLRQLYIEKHALEQFISQKKSSIDKEDMTVRQAADLQSEEAFLKEIIKDINFANEKIKRDIDDIYS